MTTIREEVAVMRSEIVGIKEAQSSMKDDISKVLEKLEALPDRFDQRYASKTVERAVYGMIASVCLSVLSALLYLVVANP
jgi:hypothetical protein